MYCHRQHDPLRHTLKPITKYAVQINKLLGQSTFVNANSFGKRDFFEQDTSLTNYIRFTGDWVNTPPFTDTDN